MGGPGEQEGQSEEKSCAHFKRIGREADRREGLGGEGGILERKAKTKEGRESRQAAAW